MIFRWDQLFIILIGFIIRCTAVVTTSLSHGLGLHGENYYIIQIMNKKNKEYVLPNLIIAGTPKSGTSSIFTYLRAHPSVCGSKIKETAFFQKGYLGRINEDI